MDKMSRRKFLKLIGAGSGVLAASALSMPGVMSLVQNKDSLSFRGVAGVPANAFPAYASYIVQGHVSLSTKTGVVTKGLYAGAPSENSSLALPGTSRAVRVTDVFKDGEVTRILGVVDDRSTLLPGETARVDIMLDQAAGIAEAVFFGSRVTMRLTG